MAKASKDSKRSRKAKASKPKLTRAVEFHGDGAGAARAIWRAGVGAVSMSDQGSKSGPEDVTDQKMHDLFALVKLGKKKEKKLLKELGSKKYRIRINKVIKASKKRTKKALEKPMPELSDSSVGDHPGDFSALRPETSAVGTASMQHKVARQRSGSAFTDGQGRLSRPSGTRDELTRIKGVGPVLHQRLNQFGIFHFWQIAELTEGQIEALQSDLGIGTRIQRDRWREQAKVLISK